MKVKIIFISLFLLLSCKPNLDSIPRVQGGVIDLRNWNFEKDGPIKLNGEWEFYWNQLYTETEILDLADQPKQFYNFPKVWNGLETSDGKLSGDGFATFKIKILLPNNTPSLGIRAQQQATAFQISFFGETFGSGQVGKTKDTSKPVTIPSQKFFYKSEIKEANLILQISNFHHRKGGAWNTIYLSQDSDIANLTNVSRNTDYFFAGFFLFVIVYHFAFFALKQRDKSTLTFSLFALMILLRSISTEDKILTDLDFFNNFEIIVRIEYFAAFWAPSFAMHFIHNLFPKEVKFLLCKFYYVLSILFSIFLLFPVKILNYTVILYQYILILTPLVLFYFICIALKNKRDYALPMLIGSISILFSNLHDYALLNEWIAPTRYMMPYGAMILTFCQSFSILMKFSQAIVKNEELSRTLITTTLMYSRFVPSELIALLGKANITEIGLGDQIQKRMTILFSDIRSFTEISEKMSPADNFNYLNSYLQIMTPFIKRNNGFIDKYIGDAIMALFPINADDALNSAILMHNELRVYNNQLFARKQKPIRIGIGIHTGNLMLGTIGSEDRLQGTVISDSVNIASRIENLTKVYGSKILISMETLLELEDSDKYFYRILDRVRVKGKVNHISVVEILDANNESALELFKKTKPRFETALKHYMQKSFLISKQEFEAILNENPFDNASKLYLERSVFYEKHGVPLDWVEL